MAAKKGQKRPEGAGRKTEWTPEIEEKALAYVEGGWSEYGHAMPSIVGLCKVLQVSRVTIYNWAKHDDKDFKSVIEACNEEQELVLLNGSLLNKLNSNIAKLVLGKHGYHDKQDTKVDASVSLTEMTDDQLDEKLKALVDATTK
jgi:hypothetical protein